MYLAELLSHLSHHPIFTDSHTLKLSPLSLMSTTNVTHIHTITPCVRKCRLQQWWTVHTATGMSRSRIQENEKTRCLCEIRFCYFFFVLYVRQLDEFVEKIFLFLISNRCRHFMRFDCNWNRINDCPDRKVCFWNLRNFEFNLIWLADAYLGLNPTPAIILFKFELNFVFFSIQKCFWILFSANWFIRSWKNTAQTQTRFIFDAFVLVRNSYFDGKKKSIENEHLNIMKLNSRKNSRFFLFDWK